MNFPVDISGTVLSTGRLTLRPWREEDLEDFYAYASVDGVGQMAGWTPHKNRQESQRILDRFIAHKKTFALELKESGKVIGSVGIERYDEKEFPEMEPRRCREIGFVLSREYWGRGLMPEAVREVIRYLFEEEGADVLLCGRSLSNRQSGRAQEKCGFTFYRMFPHENQATGDCSDGVMNVLWRRDWGRPPFRTVPIDVSQARLETGRLILRPWKEEDLADLFAYASQEDVGRMAGWRRHESMDDSRKLLEHFIRFRNVFALERKSDRKVIGHIEIWNQTKFEQLAGKVCLEIGASLSRDCWGQGIMPEAAEKVCGFLFAQMNADAVIGEAMASNRRSLRGMEKCGFAPYCTSVFTTKDGAAEPSAVYLLSREGWAGRHPAGSGGAAGGTDTISDSAESGDREMPAGPSEKAASSSISQSDENQAA